ncbi:MAG TPA: PIN domain-containing protein [Opitutaceae bacterium]
MKPEVIADTSALVALFNPADLYHEWAVAQARELTASLLTCEAVVTESLHLLRRVPGGGDVLMDFWERGELDLAFAAKDHVSRLRELQRKFSSVPMSFADACLVRMSEFRTRAVIWTADADFRIYRRQGREIIPLLAPAGL